jgi:hypothetical protein
VSLWSWFFTEMKAVRTTIEITGVSRVQALLRLIKRRFYMTHCGVITPGILNLCSRRRWPVRFTLRPLHPRSQNTGTRWLEGLTTAGDRNISYSCRESNPDPSIFQSTAYSIYTLGIWNLCKREAGFGVPLRCADTLLVSKCIVLVSFGAIPVWIIHLSKLADFSHQFIVWLRVPWLPHPLFIYRRREQCWISLNKPTICCEIFSWHERTGCPRNHSELSGHTFLSCICTGKMKQCLSVKFHGRNFVACRTSTASNHFSPNTPLEVRVNRHSDLLSRLAAVVRCCSILLKTPSVVLSTPEGRTAPAYSQMSQVTRSDSPLSSQDHTWRLSPVGLRHKWWLRPGFSLRLIHAGLVTDSGTGKYSLHNSSGFHLSI